LKFGLAKLLIGILLLAGAFSAGYMTNDLLMKNSDNEDQITQQPVYFPAAISQKIKAQGKDGATCTTGTDFTVVITGGNKVSDNPRYRVICGNFDSRWVKEDKITITGLKRLGPYSAVVKVSDNPENPDKGNIEETAFTFFKLKS